MPGCHDTPHNNPGVPPPDQESTPRRTVRVDDELWEAAKRVAADRGETVTDAIIRGLKRYVREHPED